MSAVQETTDVRATRGDLAHSNKANYWKEAPWKWAFSRVDPNGCRVKLLVWDHEGRPAHSRAARRHPMHGELQREMPADAADRPVLGWDSYDRGKFETIQDVESSIAAARSTARSLVEAGTASRAEVEISAWRNGSVGWKAVQVWTYQAKVEDRV